MYRLKYNYEILNLDEKILEVFNEDRLNLIYNKHMNN